MESTEPEFEWDEEGEVTSADPGEELESHWFIENFMVLANEQVASFLEREQVPTVYRVHDLPDPFHVDHLLDILSSLGLPTPLFDPMMATSDDVRRVTRETAEWIDTHAAEGLGKAALTQQVLRAQSRAVYDTVNIGHFGLASSTYCHFTSPIRRYPDLLVHRALLGRLGLAPEPAVAFLSEWAEHCSKTEREAAKIELKADDIVLAHLLKRRLCRGRLGKCLRGPDTEPHAPRDVRPLRSSVPGLPVDSRVAPRRVPAERAGDRPRGPPLEPGLQAGRPAVRCGFWPSMRCGGGSTSRWPARQDERWRRRDDGAGGRQRDVPTAQPGRRTRPAGSHRGRRRPAAAGAAAVGRVRPGTACYTPRP